MSPNTAMPEGLVNFALVPTPSATPGVVTPAMRVTAPGTQAVGDGDGVAAALGDALGLTVQATRRTARILCTTCSVRYRVEVAGM